MTEGRDLPARAAPAQDVAAPVRRFTVSPGEVWEAPTAPAPPRPGQAARERRAFLAPVITAVLLSAALLYGVIGLLALLWALLR